MHFIQFRIMIFVMQTTLFLLCVFLHCSRSAAQELFRAAFAKVDITPDRSQWLHGYAPRQSDGIRDPIFHRIAIMHDGVTEFVLVSTDVCTISPVFYDEFCKRFESETGIPSSNLWWTTTHTHSAPHLGPQDMGRLFYGTLGDRFSIQDDPAYWKWAQDQIMDGIKTARKNLVPAKLSIIKTVSEANVNRREKNAEGKIVLGVNLEGPVDRQVGILRVDNQAGELLGLIVNYAIHGTAFNGENKKISGDVTGIVAKYVEDQTKVPMLFINGAEGNVAPRYSVGGAIESPLLERYKSLLGDAILNALDQEQEATDNVKLQLSKIEVLTPRKEGLGWLDELQDYSAISDDGQQLVKLPVWSLVINDSTLIWSAPLELFSEYALAVRASSPYANTFYFGLTNGSMLYLPTAAAFAEGGYEPNVSVFTPSAEAAFIETVQQHTKRLFQHRNP